MQEKKEGWGEDSNPILFTNNDSILIGVFDGMGGAGGAECVSDFSHEGINKTQAYVGSRIIRDAIEKAIKENPEILLSHNLSKELENIIKCRFSIEREKYPSKPKSALRSALIKEYPTTLAITCVNHTTAGYIIDSLWAGDSRNYIWLKDGLFQISIDDLKGNLDPMQNLREDAPISNCVQANAPFTINHNLINIEEKEKFVAISATDGCFGYYPSPMDFESAIYYALRASNTIQDFKEHLRTAFERVTADDFSFAFAPVGFKDFFDLKKHFSTPSKLLATYFDKRKDYERKERRVNKKIAKLRKNLSKHKNKVDEKMMALWPEYKHNYLKFTELDERR